MIVAAHTLIYSEDPPVTRARFSDVVGLVYEAHHPTAYDR